MSKIASLFLFLSLFHPFGAAFAAGQDFHQVAGEIARNCNFEAGTCSGYFTARVLMREDARGLFKRFDKQAKKFAQGWGDTILEGDYYAFGNAKAFRAMEISKSGEVIAYQMEYFEEAISTDRPDCQRDEGINEDAWNYFGTCKVGRIYEVVYLSADFSQDKADDSRYATFFESAAQKAKDGYPP